jgi:hypothetical protein
MEGKAGKRSWEKNVDPTHLDVVVQRDRALHVLDLRRVLHPDKRGRVVDPIDEAATWKDAIVLNWSPWLNMKLDINGYRSHDHSFLPQDSNMLIMSNVFQSAGKVTWNTLLRSGITNG